MLNGLGKGLDGLMCTECNGLGTKGWPFWDDLSINQCGVEEYVHQLGDQVFSTPFVRPRGFVFLSAFLLGTNGGF